MTRAAVCLHALRYTRHLTPYTFDHAAPDTLDAYAGFVQHQNRAVFQERLGDGRLIYEQLCQMHSGRGLEAAWANETGRIVVHRIRIDLPEVGLEVLARHLAVTAADRRLILNGTFAPMQDAPWLAAG
ncbi:hypothetical protein [Deinococcus sp.]|uniref:hypothetical protein n=1 Tax=Deinococcus sp. TaxID=47478 RepID=UPI003C7A2F98